MFISHIFNAPISLKKRVECLNRIFKAQQSNCVLLLMIKSRQLDFLGFPCDILINKLSTQYVPVLYWQYFLVLFYFSVILLLFSCSTIPWHSDCSTSVPLFRQCSSVLSVLVFCQCFVFHSSLFQCSWFYMPLSRQSCYLLQQSQDYCFDLVSLISSICIRCLDSRQKKIKQAIFVSTFTKLL